jgi:AcrR family transcriptional regulator
MPTSRAARTPRKSMPPLAAKKQPAQQRATETFELILEVTAQTLADVGIERLSTNLVCERAGLTPPALYRYFPNKYALLYELGQRLMQRQNELIPRWITAEVLTGSADGLERAIQGLLLDTHRVTQDTVGGMWITRALRAVPALQKVRLESHEHVTAAQTELLTQAFPGVDVQELRLIGRVAVEMIYAAVELLFDEPLNAQAVAQIVAAMVASQLSRVQQSSKPAKKRRGA